MTPEEQRIAIAEACGYTMGEKSEPSFSDPSKYIHSPSWIHPRGYAVRTLPDYLEDLNAMHEAEKVLLELKQPDKAGDVAGYPLLPMYLFHLMHVVCPQSGARPDSDGQYWAFVRATAAQRAEAFLRTIGKWKD